MAPKLLKEFVLGCGINTFVNRFWLDVAWYERFLSEKLLDISINIEEWALTSAKSKTSFTRKVKSYHPSKISFPGLPSHAESHKTQTYDLTEKDNFMTLSIKETNSFRGIPYADYFTVNTEWVIVSNSIDGSECVVKIFLDFNFMKSTWLQGTIESNTRSELLSVYELWYSSAEEDLSNENVLEGLTVNLDSLSYNSVLRDNRDGTISKEIELSERSYSMSVNVSNPKSSLLSEPRSRSLDTDDNKSQISCCGSDDDMQFFDCEDEKIWPVDFHHDGYNYKREKHDRYMDSRDEQDRYSSSSSVRSNGPSTPERLRIQYSYPTHAEGEVSSLKDLAVTFVETSFVLVEFSFLKVHRVYTHDLRELFDVDLKLVFTRILNSFVPGRHSQILLNPDLYGPVIGVLLMPQILLLSMGVTRHGCNQSALLGNAVVVSLCLWMGLSSLYRILAFIIAPTIEIKHCLSITGYSFFAWNLALLMSYPLETYQEIIGMPVFVPLALFGLPSAVAQGCMFWEHTPASSLTLQPTAFPSSLQQCASQHIRCLQRMAWAVPKVIAFIVVTATHYQFLWYLARVYMPGKKEACQLSALVQPSQYADIITQKELMKYALMILSGKKPH